MPTTTDSPLIAGKRYVSNKFRPGLMFTLPDGAWVGQDAPGGVTMRLLPSAPIRQGILSLNHISKVFDPRRGGRTIADAVAAPRRLRNLARAPPPPDGLKAGTGDARPGSTGCRSTSRRSRSPPATRPSATRRRSPRASRSGSPSATGSSIQRTPRPASSCSTTTGASSSSRRSPTPPTPSPRSGPSSATRSRPSASQPR